MPYMARYSRRAIAAPLGRMNWRKRSGAGTDILAAYDANAGRAACPAAMERINSCDMGSSRHLASDAVGVEHEAAIAQIHEFIEFGGVEQNGAPLAHQKPHHAVDP